MLRLGQADWDKLDEDKLNGTRLVPNRSNKELGKLGDSHMRGSP